MITVLCSGYIYLNPSRPLLLRALATIAPEKIGVIDLTTAAPEETTRRLASSDVVVLDQSLINAAYWTELELDSTPGTYYMPRRRSRSYYADALSRALELPVARAFFSYSDLHDQKDISVFELLAPRVDALFWAYFKEPIAPATVPNQYRDPFMAIHGNPVERFEVVKRQFPVRVDVWHALGRPELEHRPRTPLWDVCVPGANYRTRTVAHEAVTDEGLSRPPFQLASKILRELVGGAAKLLPSEATASASIRSQQAMQRTLVRRSRVTFVCGSGLTYAVRKFAEVPGLRSAMIAYPCTGFGDLGFRDGVNALVCLPEEAGRVARRLIQDERLRERLVSEAWNLVQTCHSVERRAAEVLYCLERMGSGTLHGGEFVEGKFEVT
jgi:hypothetical protein